MPLWGFQEKPCQCRTIHFEISLETNPVLAVYSPLLTLMFGDSLGRRRQGDFKNPDRHKLADMSLSQHGAPFFVEESQTRKRKTTKSGFVSRGTPKWAVCFWFHAPKKGRRRIALKQLFVCLFKQTPLRGCPLGLPLRQQPRGFWGCFPHSFLASFFLKNRPNLGKPLFFFDKETMVEKNGESTPTYLGVVRVLEGTFFGWLKRETPRINP